MCKILWYATKSKKKSIFFSSALLLIATGLFFSTASAPVSAIPEQKQKVPIVMYHSVLDSKDREGKYVITPEKLEEDFKYIKENGYQTITTSDLISYKNGEKNLPEKSIVITFDDGYYNNYSYLFPLLKKYDMKAVLSVVGVYTDLYSESDEKMNNNYSHADWSQLKEMQDSGFIELQNHSYNMHDWSQRKGILRKKGENKQEYEKLLKEDILKMQQLLKSKTGKDATAFVYPFGSVNDESRKIVEELGFSVTYGCEEGVNLIDKDSSLKDLKRYNRHGSKNTEEFYSKLFR